MPRMQRLADCFVVVPWYCASIRSTCSIRAPICFGGSFVHRGRATLSLASLLDTLWVVEAPDYVCWTSFLPEIADDDSSAIAIRVPKECLQKLVQILDLFVWSIYCWRHAIGSMSWTPWLGLANGLTLVRPTTMSHGSG